MEAIFIFVGSVFWTILSGVAIYLFVRSADHEKRIQRVEDVQGSKIDNLKADFDSFRIETNENLKNIFDQIHKEKNEENQIKTVLNLLLEKLSQ